MLKNVSDELLMSGAGCVAGREGTGRKYENVGW